MTKFNAFFCLNCQKDEPYGLYSDVQVDRIETAASSDWVLLTLGRMKEFSELTAKHKTKDSNSELPLAHKHQY